jgi:negative regulator of flagellin synthesis FlgM
VANARIKVKINNPVNRPQGVTGAVELNNGKAPAAPQPAGRGSGDTVSVTPLASQLQALESRLADASVVDTARVDAIKQAISEGRFSVNSEVVADRLIATVKEYLLSQKG